MSKVIFSIAVFITALFVAMHASAGDAPKYKPSSRSPAPLDITTNEYGFSNTAPNALGIGETVPHFTARDLYARRIKLLMQSGLVAGITPTSIRKRSNQLTLDFAFCRPVGGD